MILLKSKDEIALMRRINGYVAEVLASVEEAVAPGCTTNELDALAEYLALEKGGKPAFKGYRGFPKSLCTSVNDEIVHGIPNDKMLAEGDIVSVDFGLLFEGFYGDSAVTIPVGKITKEAQKLIDTTKQSLYQGLRRARLGKRLFDISHAIQTHVEANGFSIVREFVGHGIGRSLHEDPQIPNYGKANRGVELAVGMVLAIEPMVNAGSPGVKIRDDQWTAVTDDGNLSAHFEHSVAVTEDGPVILSQI